MASNTVRSSAASAVPQSVFTLAYMDAMVTNATEYAQPRMKDSTPAIAHAIALPLFTHTFTLRLVSLSIQDSVRLSLAPHYSERSDVPTHERLMHDGLCALACDAAQVDNLSPVLQLTVHAMAEPVAHRLVRVDG
jgi:hypothetical protein